MQKINDLINELCYVHHQTKRTDVLALNLTY